MKSAASTQPMSAAGPAMVSATKAPKSQPEPSVVPAEIQSRPKKPTSRRSPSSVLLLGHEATVGALESPVRHHPQISMAVVGASEWRCW